MAKFTIDDKFWTGVTGVQIRDCGKDAQLLALHLLTCPSANSLGLYNFTVEQAARLTSLTDIEVKAALDMLIGVGFCAYNNDSGMIFVRNMAAYQNGTSIKYNDNKIVNINAQIKALPANEPLVKKFIKIYQRIFFIPGEGQPNLIRKPLQEYTSELSLAVKASNVFNMIQFNSSDPLIKQMLEQNISVEEFVGKAVELYNKPVAPDKTSNVMRNITYVYKAVISHREQIAAKSVEGKFQSQGGFSQSKFSKNIAPENFDAVTLAESNARATERALKRGGNVTTI